MSGPASGVDATVADAPAAGPALTLLGGQGVVCEGDVCAVPGFETGPVAGVASARD